MSWNSGWLPSGVPLPRRVTLGGGVRRRRAGTPTRTRSSSPRVARGKEGHIVRDMTWPDTVGGEYFFSGSFSTWARNARFVTSLPGLAREARS